MIKPVKKYRIKNLVIKELSLVDRPANQGAYVILGKSSPRTTLGFKECLALISKLDSCFKPKSPMTVNKVTPPKVAQDVRQRAVFRKADVNRALMEYVQEWRHGPETPAQTLVRLSANQDPMVVALYDQYLRAEP